VRRCRARRRPEAHPDGDSARGGRRARYDSGMSRRRSVTSERGSSALEFLVGLALIALVCATFAAIGYGLGRLGWMVAGRIVWMLPLLVPGLVNLCIAWRPGDQHEAKSMARLAAVVRGVAMVGATALFAVDPDALPFWAFMVIFFGGIALSFVVLSLPWSFARMEPR
jgi:hypothetical protein